MPRIVRCLHPQRGMVALLTLLLALTFVVGVLIAGAGASQRIARDLHTSQTLALAKEALIGYAVAKGNPPGSLPCPDLTNNNGTAAASCSSYIGRLPWKTLGLGDLRDADGECLWYALSPAFKNGVATLNSTTTGSITLQNGTAAPIAQVIAVVFAPGAMLPGKTHAASGTGACAGNASAGNYLDVGPSGIDNATGNRSGNNLSFVATTRSASFNDQLSYIAATDLFAALHARVAAEIRGTDNAGLRRYFINTAQTLPWAASAAGGTQQAQLGNGFVPLGDPAMMYPGSTWLNSNGWFAIARYQVSPPNRATITLGASSYAYAFE